MISFSTSSADRLPLVSSASASKRDAAVEHLEEVGLGADVDADQLLATQLLLTPAELEIEAIGADSGRSV